MGRIAKRYLQENMKPVINVPVYKVGIYCRLSVDHHDKKSESIENQITIIKKYIEDNNLNINKKAFFEIYDIYIDKGISGTTFKREGFERLLEDVKKKVVNCIIVKDLSRFGRNYLETGNYIEKIFPFIGVRFIAISENFDSMDASADSKKLLLNIKNLTNDMYAKQISKNVILSRRQYAEKGQFIGSVAPYGYKIVKDELGRHLEVRKECIGVVKLIYSSFLSGMSYRNIAALLYEKKIHRYTEMVKYGHVFCEEGEELYQWKEDVIMSILTKRVYKGCLVQGKYQSKLKTGKKNVINENQDDWIIVENAHEAMIDAKTFEAVQEILKGRAEERLEKGIEEVHVPLNNENVYGSLIYCAKCGLRMQALYKNGKYKYHCRANYYIDGRQCEQNIITEEKVEELVKGEIRNFLKENKIKGKDLVELNRHIAEEKRDMYITEINKLRIQLEREKKHMAEVYFQYKEGNVDYDIFQKYKKNKTEYEEFAIKRIADLEKKIQKSKRRAEEENSFLRALTKVRSNKKLTVELVVELIERIEVSPDKRIDITFKFNKVGVADE